MFDIDEVYNSQNNRISAVNRAVPEIEGSVRRKRRFPQKVMVWLGVCSKGASPLVVFECETLNHSRYVRKMFPLVLKYGNDMFGDD